MVCIYCGSPTQVTNSRLQKQANNVWRRRSCTQCGSTFTTHEAPDLAGSLRVVMSQKTLAPFSRDTLFVSIYEACKHRASALDDAAALTHTIIGRLIPAANNGQLDRETIITVTQETLERFDKTAATVYGAFHKV